MSVGRWLAGLLNRHLPEVAEPINEFFDWLVGPIAEVYGQYAGATPVEAGTVATGLAAMFVLARLGGAYFLWYTILGLVKPVFNFDAKQRHGLSAVVFGATMVISAVVEGSALWPASLLTETETKVATVMDMVTRQNPDVQIGLEAMVWDVGKVFGMDFGAELNFAIVVALAVSAFATLVYRMTGSEAHVKIVSIWVPVAAVAGYGIVSLVGIQVFPIPAWTAFTIQLAALTSVFFAITWIGAMGAVGFVRALESFHVKDTPETPPRHKVFTGAVMLGVFISVFPTMHALLAWFGVLVYIAGGGWDMAYRLAGGQKQQKEVCQVRDDGTQVCRTESDWELNWRGGSSNEGDTKWD